MVAVDVMYSICAFPADACIQHRARRLGNRRETGFSAHSERRHQLALPARHKAQPPRFRPDPTRIGHRPPESSPASTQSLACVERSRDGNETPKGRAYLKCVHGAAVAAVDQPRVTFAPPTGAGWIEHSFPGPGKYQIYATVRNLAASEADISPARQ